MSCIAYFAVWQLQLSPCSHSSFVLEQGLKMSLSSGAPDSDACDKDTNVLCSLPTSTTSVLTNYTF